MGADPYEDWVKKSDTVKTAQDAFNAVTKQARYDYGHAGYTGTIAEKDSFIMADPQREFTHKEDLQNWLNDQDSGKWEPANCIEWGDYFIFYGWASS